MNYQLILVPLPTLVELNKMVDIDEEKSKKFLSAMDSTLSTFQSINEWPDFISFLGKLSKTISTYSSQKYLSRKLQVTKRLAQCLNPAHPTGVHQKALEIYDQIFSMLELSYLERNIEILTFGLFTFFKHSSMSVKPVLLEIFDKHIVSSSSAIVLRSLMENLVGSLLSGIEEPNEYFERCIELLWKIESKSAQCFFSSFWSVIGKYSHCRLGGLNFVLRGKGVFFQKMLAVKDSLDLDIICVGISKCLVVEKDSLVVRHALDVACKLFPLVHINESESLEELSFSLEQKKIFIQSILVCLLKRNYSLTRRVYSWILGSSSEADSVDMNDSSMDLRGDVVSESKSLSTEAKKLITDCFLDMLHVSNANDIQILLLPYKIMGHFLDRSDISTEIFKSIFMDFLLCAFENYSLYGDDYLAGVNRLFSLVDLELAWNEIFDYFHRNSILQHFALIEFILKKTNMIDEEAKSIFIPNLFLLLLKSNCYNHSLLQTVHNLCEFNYEYDHSLVQLKQESFDISTNERCIYSNCLFYLLKTCRVEFIESLLVLFNNVKLVNFKNIDVDLSLDSSINSKKIRLILLQHGFIAYTDKLQLITEMLGVDSSSLSNIFTSDSFQLISLLQTMFPHDCEKFLIIQYNKCIISIDVLISYWLIFSHDLMLLTTCLLLEKINLHSYLLTDDEISANRWIMDANLNFEKLTESLLNLIPIDSNQEIVIGLLENNSRQVFYVIEKFQQIFSLRKEYFFYHLSHSTLQKAINSTTNLSDAGSEPILATLLNFILKITKCPYKAEFFNIHSAIINLLLENFDIFPDKIIIESILLNLTVSISHYLEPVLFKKLLTLLFRIISLKEHSEIHPLLSSFGSIQTYLNENHACLTEYCFFLTCLYSKNPSESYLLYIENVVNSLLAFKYDNNFNVNVFQASILILFLMNGGSFLNLPIILPTLTNLNDKQIITKIQPIQHPIWRQLCTCLSGISKYLLSVYGVSQCVPKKSCLNVKLILKILEISFLELYEDMDYVLITCYNLDSEMFVDCFLQFWSEHKYKKNSNTPKSLSKSAENLSNSVENLTKSVESLTIDLHSKSTEDSLLVSLIIEKVNFFANYGFFNHHRTVSLTLSLCLFTKKNSSSSTTVNDTVGLDFLQHLISSDSWLPLLQQVSLILSSLRDFFDSNRGRFTFLGCKFFVYITRYILNAGFTDKKLLKESQDLLLKMLNLSTSKMSKLILSIKKVLKNQTFEQSFEFKEMESLINFYNVNIFSQSEVLGSDPSEFLIRFISEIIIPLLSIGFPVGWQCLDSISAIVGWVKYWKKEFSVDFFSGNRDFFKEDFNFTKNKCLGIAWSQQGSVIESDRFSEWISSRLVLPLPSNVNMLFMNREAEFISRCDNIHQLSAIIFSCPKGHFARSFPLLNEKIVESFKVLEKCVVHSEIMLLVKVILVRFDSNSIGNFLPVLFSELYSILQLSADGSEFKKSDSLEIFSLVYRTCQVLDLLFTINSYEFQSYLNIFYSPNLSTGILDHWRNSFELKIASVINEPIIEHQITQSYYSKKRILLVEPLENVNEIFDFFPLLNMHSWKYQKADTNAYEIDYEFINTTLSKEIYCYK